MIRINEFMPDDYDAVISLWRSVDGLVLRTVDERAPITAYLARNPGLSFVARDADAVVGAVLCGTDGRRGYLQHLAVASSHRRAGIGRTLAHTALDALGAKGITKCHLFVVTGNDSAFAFWRAMGWEQREDIVMFSHAMTTPGVLLCDV